ncbi:Eco57I restriction-modification methylase domain-containing protein [Empedobacter sp. 225-1]|uniref:Eco57I restriction-modification methylase domain-containing protein n=1 Tax=Empedobacter sp. 225-1 TaxID=2746725 RepID=UPI0025776A05|nr:Eco57I restriction-modification methylase domain-containing protein [Empedobacter sp. 225-1]MDM1523076.1 Eco57I restriction-modification methylase domain-containing protein [Empedobacter sp. 225-1]
MIDEGLPKPLPNLDFKIVVGNSLSSKFGLDDNMSTIFKDFNKKLKKKEIKDSDILSLIDNNKLDLEFYKKIIDEFATESNHDKKIAFKKLVQAIKESFRSSLNKNKNEKLSEARGKLFNLEQTDIFGNIKGSKKEISAAKKTLKEVEKLMKDFENDEVHKDAIEWRFEFPHLLDDEANFKGFDIVIGNPPYIKEYTNKTAFDGFRKSKYYQGKMDIWYAFTCIAIDLLKTNGVQSFIAQNNWITSAGASIVRNKVLKETEFKLFTDFWNYKVFKTAGIQTMVYVLKKKTPSDQYQVKYSVLKDSNIKESDLVNFLDFNKPFSYAEKFILDFNYKEFIDGNIVFNHPDIQNILNKILDNDYQKLKDSEVANGIHPHYDFVAKKMLDKLSSEFKIGDGIFGISKQELENLNLSSEEYKLIKRYYSGTEHFKKYYGKKVDEQFIIYTDSSFKNPNSMDIYPNLKYHLDKFQNIISSDNRPYGLHRARKEDFFLGEKIAVQRKCPNEPIFTYLDFESYLSATFYVIKSDRFNIKYLTVLLNSKLIKFWLRYKGKMQGDNYQLDKEPLVEIPIINSTDQMFSCFLDMLTFLYSNNTRVNEMVKNEIIAKYFEDIMDGCVFDLYFTDYMKLHNLYITDTIKKECNNYLNIYDFKNLEVNIKCEIIWNIYEKLSYPDHFVKNSILKYPIQSPDILKLILEN